MQLNLIYLYHCVPGASVKKLYASAFYYVQSFSICYSKQNAQEDPKMLLKKNKIWCISVTFSCSQQNKKID